MLVKYKDTVPITGNMEEVEKLLVEQGTMTESPPTKHQFSEGVYLREITMPSKSFILGHKHKTKHFNIISKGSCILLDLEEGTQTYIEAPCTFESDVGAQKLLYIVDECVWSTVHVTDETDVDTIEEMILDNPTKYDEYRLSKEV